MAASLFLFVGFAFCTSGRLSGSEKSSDKMTTMNKVLIC